MDIFIQHKKINSWNLERLDILKIQKQKEERKNVLR